MVNISLTASDKIKEMLASEETPNMFLRLGVKSGGCSGFSYGMGFDDKENSDDQVFELHGLKVVVDGDSAKYLYGVEIDFKESGMGGGFTIDNPNAVASCGCGSSFKPADYEGTPEPCDDKVEA